MQPPPLISLSFHHPKRKPLPTSDHSHHLPSPWQPWICLLRLWACLCGHCRHGNPPSVALVSGCLPSAPCFQGSPTLSHHMDHFPPGPPTGHASVKTGNVLCFVPCWVSQGASTLSVLNKCTLRVDCIQPWGPLLSVLSGPGVPQI